MHALHQQEKARIDLNNIWHYSYERYGEKQADKYYDELIVGMQAIQQNPQIGVACDYIRSGYRQYKINEHFVFYQITERTLHIMRVLHQSMDAVQNMVEK
jgi:toxin ParE1/3/4